MKEIEVEDSTIKNINSPEYVLKHVFKLKSFRHPQQEIIEHALKGYNIFVLMPTGGGKSLCYQLPAVIDKGITLVISPLIALISNQISILNSLKIPAKSLNSSLKISEKKRNFK
jgi:ATP-dependent DNA helicase RecQ